MKRLLIQEVESKFRELLDKKAMIKSTSPIPSNIAILMIIVSIPDISPPPLTKIDP